MSIRIATALRTAACDAMVDMVDAGSGPGYAQIRTGTKPATPATAVSGTLLATVTFSDPAFGAASSGVATASAVTGDASVDASGNAGYFRVFDSNNNALWDGDITATGGGGDMTLASIALVAGGTYDITSWTATMPMG